MVEATFEQAYPIAARAAKVRATAAVVSGAIPVADREDFEQEGLTACWRALPQFDPARASLRTFIERVIASRIASLVRTARRSPAHVSLNAAGPQPVDSGVDVQELYTDVERIVIGVRMPRPAVDSPAAGILARGGRPDAGPSSLDGPRQNPPIAPQVRRGWLCAERRSAMMPSPSKSASPMVSTYSMWCLFRNCRKAVDWRYIQQLVGLERDGNLHFGSLVHQCLELWHQCRDLGRVLDLIGTLCPNRCMTKASAGTGTTPRL